MEVKNHFEVGIDPKTSWEFLLTPDRMIPCLPGATFIELTEDGTWVAKAKIKVGPVTLQYKGKLNIVERDDDTMDVKMKAQGTETKGKGSVKADIFMSVTAKDDGGSRVDVSTDVTITGKAAQYARGMVSDVAEQFTEQFAKNMEYQLAQDVQAAAEEAAADAAAVAEKAAEEAAEELKRQEEEEAAEAKPAKVETAGDADKKADKDEATKKSEDDSNGGGDPPAVGKSVTPPGIADATAAIEALIAKAESAAERAEKAAKKASAASKVAEAQAKKADAAAKRAEAAAQRLALAQKEAPTADPPNGLVLVFGALWRAIKRFFGGGSKPDNEEKAGQLGSGS
ncbi:MAG: SRPBCC family protein [Myxococcota bacterium]